MTSTSTATTGPLPELLPISQFVRLHTPAVVAHCEQVDPDEFARLLDPSYCTETFGLSSVSFFRASAELSSSHPDDQRYGKGPDFRYEVARVPVRLTSQWFKNRPVQYRRFVAYLGQLGVLAPDHVEALHALLDTLQPASAKPATGVPKIAIGDAQNAWVRHVLDQLRPDAESFGGKRGTWEKFDRRCAYCDVEVEWGTFDEDHVYSINYGLGLGENKRGNLVPACKKCNNDKSARQFRAFLHDLLQDDPEEAQRRIARIEQHMADCGYLPLRDDPSVDVRAVQAIIECWRAKVKDLTDACVAELREELRDETTSGEAPTGAARVTSLSE